MPASPVHQVVTALAARTHGQIMRSARKDGTSFIVDRRGKHQVVIMDIRDFLKSVAPEKKVMATVRRASSKLGKDQLSGRQIEREIRAYRREQSPGCA